MWRDVKERRGVESRERRRGGERWGDKRVGKEWEGRGGLGWGG